MIIYKLTEQQVTEWSGKYGINEFRPIKDVNGNWVSDIKNGENMAFPFVAELKKCPKIAFVAAQNKL